MQKTIDKWAQNSIGTQQEIIIIDNTRWQQDPQTFRSVHPPSPDLFSGTSPPGLITEYRLPGG